MLDLLVEGVPSPAKKGSPIEVEGASRRGVRLQDGRRSVRGPDQRLPRAQGDVSSDATLANVRTHGKERVGALLTLQGKEHEPADEFGEGDLGAVAKLKDVMTGDLLLDSDQQVELPSLDFPEPVMSFAITPKAKGDEEKVATSLRRLSEEDPTLQLRRDPQTGEQLVSGMTQMHVEVAVDRLKRRFGVEVDLNPPRVPVPRDDPQGVARPRPLQEADRRPRAVRRLPHRARADRGPHRATSSSTRSSAASSRRASGRRSTRASRRRCVQGELAGAPVQGVRVLLVDGSYHTVDSSEMAFKIAGSMAFKQAYEQADPVLLEPIMEVDVTVPDDTVGSVNGDLNSRRGTASGHGADRRA